MPAPIFDRWAEIGPRIDELLTLPSLEREGLLDALAAKDPETAAQLRRLFHARDAANRVSFLGGVADVAALPPSVAAGDTLGAWTLVGLIGEGGMGSVWRARRSDGRFEGEAAIKLLRTGVFDAGGQERFRREGAILARLRHPGIAQLLDAGVTARGQPYLVLELVDGEPIDRWCKAHRLGVRATLETFVQVLDAVAAAHAQLIVHRDLKPSNILVDAAGRVCLLDFGIAKLLDDKDAGLTREGALILTPRYAAPEQFAGDEASMATDVYPLGVVLHELLTGEHPSGLPEQTSAPQHMKAAAAGGFKPPSERAPQRRRELRGDLDTIIAKALATRPEDRYPTVIALRDDLQRHLRHEPIQARPASPLYQLAKLLRRRPFESAVVAAVVVAVPAGAYLQAAVLLSMALGTGVAVWQARRAFRQSGIARAEERRAEAVKTFIASIFGQAVPREGAGGVVTAGDLLHSAAARIRSELTAQPLVAAELMAIIAESFMDLSDVPSGRKVLPEAVAMCEKAFGRSHPITLRSRCSLLEAHITMGELDDAERLHPRLIDDLRSAMPGAARELLSALDSRSAALAKRGTEDEAIATLEEAWAIAREHFGPAHRETLSAAGKLGNTLAMFLRTDEALKVLEPTVALAREAFGNERPHMTLTALESYYAATLALLGQLPEAVALLRNALREELALQAIETNRNLWTKGTLARAIAETGALDEALALMRETIEALTRLFPGPTVNQGVVAAYLGWVLVELGRFDEGLAEMDRAEQITLAAGGGQVRPKLSRLALRAHCCLLAGRADEALGMADSLLAQEDAAAPSSRAMAARVRVGALRRLGRAAEADASVSVMLERAVWPGVSSVQRGCTAIEAAALRIEQGRAEEALEFTRQALLELTPTQVPSSPLLERAQVLLRQCQSAVAAESARTQPNWDAGVPIANPQTPRPC